nr:uncharacterized protein LOC129442299 isoform X4 [Misgurnus anguillicaudatus]
MWKEGPVCRHNGTKLGKFPAFNLPISSDAVNVKSRRLGVALESITTGSEVEGLIRVMRSNSRKKVGVRHHPALTKIHLCISQCIVRLIMGNTGTIMMGKTTH